MYIYIYVNIYINLKYIYIYIFMPVYPKKGNINGILELWTVDPKIYLDYTKIVKIYINIYIYITIFTVGHGVAF